MDRLQGMIGLITESVDTLLKSWRSKIEAEGGIADIRIDEHMRSFSGDVISRACFGSSYTKGEEIFLRLRALQEAMSKRSFSEIPGMRYQAFSYITSWLKSYQFFQKGKNKDRFYDMITDMFPPSTTEMLGS